MKNETPAQREARKRLYIIYVVSKSKGMGNTDEVIEQAKEKFEENNPQ